MIRKSTKPKAPWVTAYPAQARALRPEPVNPRREFIRQKARFLKSHPVCQCCRDAKSEQVHHKQGRLGMLLTFEPLWLACCAPCHRWIHDHIAWARRRGWICRAGLWNVQLP